MAEGDFKWKYNANKVIKSGVVVDSNGVIYFGTMWTSGSANVIALNSDGSLKWSYSNIDGATRSGLALSNDESVLYVADGDYLCAINTTDGSLAWSYTDVNMSTTYGSIIVDSNNNIYLANYGASLMSVNSSGNFRWRVGNESNSGLAIGKSNTVIYYLDNNAGLREINMTNGNINWSHQGISWGCNGTGIQIDGDGIIYYGDCSYFYAINANGTRKWGYSIGNYAGTNNAIGSNGDIWFVDLNGSNTKVIILNSDGSLDWEYNLPNWVGSGLDTTGLALDSNDTVFAGCHDYKLYAINSDNSLRWTYTAGNKIQSGIAHSPSEGTVYFGCDDGYLYAIEAKECGKIEVGDKVFLLPIGNFFGDIVALKSDVFAVSDKAFLASLDEKKYLKLAFKSCTAAVNDKVICLPIEGMKENIVALR